MALPEDVSSVDWKARRLVIVDGDDQFRFWVRGMFRNRHLREVLSVAAPWQARPALALGGFDLVLAELDDEAGAGMDFLRWLRDPTLCRCAEVPVLALVTRIDRLHLDQACRLGLHGVLRKPLTAEVLVRSVANALVRPRRIGANGILRPGLAARQAAPQMKPTPAPPVAQREAMESADPARPRRRSSGDEAVPFPPGEPAAGDVPARPAAGGKVEPAAAPRRPASGPVETAPPPAGRSGDGIETVETVPEASPLRGGAIELAAAPAAKAASDPAGWAAELAAPVPAGLPEPAGPDIEAILAAHAAWVGSRGAQGKRAGLAELDLSGRRLAGAELANAVLAGADLSAADLSGARLHHADLRRAEAPGADFTGADLSVARLRHARLEGAVLDGANLKGADLAGARLGGARLAGADMAGAILVGADLAGADLSAAEGLVQGQLDGVAGDAKTRLPSGLRLTAPPGQD